MILITEVAIVILILICILFLMVRVSFRISNAESPKAFILEKHCNKDKLHDECIKRGLTEYDYTLLCARYVDCLSSAQLEIKFCQTAGNVRRHIKSAEDKFNQSKPV